MKIEFINDYYICPKTYEVSFYLLANSKEMVCKVPYETLLEIDSENSLDSIENLFQLNQDILEGIAKEKLLRGEDSLIISKNDLKT